MANSKPYAVKGRNIASPKGRALWCRVTEPDRKYNDKGNYSTELILDGNSEETQVFVRKLEELRDTAYAETVETLGKVKSKGIVVKDVYKEELDEEGEPTGNLIFKFQMRDVDTRKENKKQHHIIVKDAQQQEIDPADVPLVGNDSIIRCVAFANPYYMPSNKSVGVSLLWLKMQLIDLQGLGGGDEDFDTEDGGYVASANPKPVKAPVDADDDELDDTDF